MTRQQFAEEITREALRAYLGVDSGFVDMKEPRRQYAVNRVLETMQRLLKEGVK